MANLDYARCSDVNDYSSLANFAEVGVKHIDLVWKVDFDTSKISGTATLTITAAVDNLTKVVLDTRDLAVSSVKADGVSCVYSLGDATAEFGAALTVTLPTAVAKGSSVDVAITYATAAQSTALQWLPPAQTAGRAKPYLFSQCQAIHARSMLPCVDSPGHKATYTAAVTVPAWATVLMSALATGVEGAAAGASEGNRTFNWSQPVACSSYLVAIAVGDLESREVSPRCRVWSEPSMVEAAAFEFSQTEDFLKAAESLAGPYRWGRYDLLCLPPSFPYGGMENPCLTFVTPTLLAGDKSLADVVAHEIAHSWTGNLVTNVSWTHFWLNEGWTRWFELSIMAEIQGDDRYFDLRASLGYEGLKADVSRFMESGDSKLTALVPPLQGIDPDDAFSSVPYERGMNLLFHLQGLIGKANMHKFFRTYVETHAATTVNTHGFRLFFEDYCAKNKLSNKIQSVDWEAWFLQEGMPPVEPTYDLSLVAPVKAYAAEVVEGGIALAKSTHDMEAWPSLQQQLFLQELLDQSERVPGGALPLATLDTLDAKYGLSAKKNSELRFKWTKLCLRAGRASILKHAASFAVEQGRMKFVRPLYRELLQAPIPGARELAIGTFAANKEGYHPICRKMVAADIEKLNGGATDKASSGGKQKSAASSAGSSDSGFVTAVVAAGFGAGVAVVLALSMAKKK